MLSTALHSIEQRRAGYSPLILGRNDPIPDALPVERWNEQAEAYRQIWNTYLGRRWTEEDKAALSTTGEPVLKYPLRVNSIKQFVQKHASVTIGETPDANDTIVRPEVTPLILPEYRNGVVPEEYKEEAKFLERFLNLAWAENDAKAIQAENILITNILGGCYFKLNYWPFDQDRLTQIRIETVMPDFVLPIWDSTDYYNLLECYIVYRIPRAEAYWKYGVDTNGMFGYYVEHWTRDTVNITIDNKPVSFGTGGTKIIYQDHKHNFGFVPIVYLPRFRAGDFYGIGWMEDVEGLLMEWNSRIADLADAIQETVHPDLFLRNVVNQVRPVELPNGRIGFDLGLTAPEGDPPEVKREDPPQLSEGLTGFGDTLWNQLLREAGLSNIVYGEDEGSQRSALTLAFRMWPVTSLARLTRIFWTVGMNTLDRYMLRIAAQKGIMGITDDMRRRVKIHQTWSAMIPRDREQQVNETLMLYQGGVISLGNAHERLGDINDSEAEQKLVWEDMKKKAETLSSAAATEGVKGGPKQPEMEPIVGDG